MQLNPGSSNGILDEINSLCSTDATSYPTADKVRRVNSAYEELIGDIINADGTWQYDDTNLTDQPIGSGNLVEGQEDYSFASEYLQIEQVEILDSNSPAVYHKIKPLDRSELGDMSTEEYFGVTGAGNPQTGFPEYFDQVGDTIRLYPAPTSASVTLTAGIKIYFKRTADLFTTADTTQEPGLPSTHHVLLAYMASVPYCAVYKQNLVPWLEKKIDSMKKTLIEHYAHREKAKRKMIIPIITSFR